jgi:hypothetical protein
LGAIFVKFLSYFEKKNPGVEPRKRRNNWPRDGFNPQCGDWDGTPAKFHNVILNQKYSNIRLSPKVWQHLKKATRPDQNPMKNDLDIN